MMSDASDMLAAALEQMDGIIAGKHLGQGFILLFGSSFLPLGGQSSRWRREYAGNCFWCLPITALS